MMALATFQTKTEATLYTKTGQVTSIKVPAGTVLVCDWEWATGVLTGKRKIVEPAYYASYFVRSVDLTTYAPPGPPTGPALTHTVEIYSDGSIRIDDSPYP